MMPSILTPFTGLGLLYLLRYFTALFLLLPVFFDMERFKLTVTARYQPKISLHTTREADAIVRTTTSDPDLPTLLGPYLSFPLTHNATLTPLPWLDASRILTEALRSPPPSNPESLIRAYSEALENVTKVADHDHLSAPVATILCAWVGEPDLLKSLKGVEDASRSALEGTAAFLYRAHIEAQEIQPESTPSAVAPHVLLVQRAQSRQDGAARDDALRLARSVYGEERTHVVLVGTEEADESPRTLAKRLENIARENIDRSILDVRRSVERLRRARSSFRSWFGGAQPTMPMRHMGYEADGALRDDSSGAISGASLGGRRRLSIGSGGVQTPLFPVDSVESRAAHLADLYMLAGRYSEAYDTFRSMQHDLRLQSGPALVYEATACEMGAMALALLDGSKQAIGSGIERAIQIYCKAGRQELAVRATLRGAFFCTDVGFPGSAAGVIIRAVDAILPSRAFAFGATSGVPATGNSFVDGALAVLYTAVGSAFHALTKRRRASLYAYLAASKFARLKLKLAAACVVRIIDEHALLRQSLRDEVELILGTAEIAEGRYVRAARHFAQILSSADDHTDLEVQSTAIRGVSEAAAKGARDALSKRWDTGIMYPQVRGDFTSVTTYDSNGGGNPSAWRTLEDDVLEDCEFFTTLAKTSVDSPLPQRGRRLSAIVDELRKKRNVGDSMDPGGSLEMKIKRMQELANQKAKKRREKSLLERGAVVGEEIVVNVMLQNPLHFPVFVNDLAAVVALDGQVYPRRVADNEENDIGGFNTPVSLVRTSKLTLVANSSQIVHIEIVPKRPGVLQVLGISWSFTVGIGGATPTSNCVTLPGFSIFERRGRRLNKTRKQRASEVPLYEADTSLTVKVVPPAPKLKGVVVASSATAIDKDLGGLVLRAGETKTAKLVLSNNGKVSLKHIVLRVGTPQNLFVGMQPDELSMRKQIKSFAIGVDDEFVSEGELCAASRMTVDLDPGQSVDIAICLRAAVSNTAFGYRAGSKGMKGSRENKRANENRTDKDGTLGCESRLIVAYGDEIRRVIRVSTQFRVQPSILVSPRFLREADPKLFPQQYPHMHGVILGLEIEHGGQKQAENVIFKVIELSVTSRTGWRPLLLQEASGFAKVVEGESKQSLTSLRINETATIFCLVVRDEEQMEEAIVGNLPQEGMWETSTVRLARDQPDISHLGMNMWDEGSGSSISEESSPVEREALTHFVLSANRNTLSSSSYSCTKKDLVYVAIRWMSSPKSHGEIYIPPINPRRWMNASASSRSFDHSVDTFDFAGIQAPGHAAGPPVPHASKEEFDRTSTNQNEWIEVSVRHDAAIEHDFFALKDVDSRSRKDSNIGPHPLVVPVNVRVRNRSSYLLDVIFEASTFGGIGEGDRGRFWAGDVAMSLRALPPGAERVLKLSAVLTGPGLYNLSLFTVMFQSCGYATLKIRKRVDVPPSYLEVKAVNSPEKWMRHGECQFLDTAISSKDNLEILEPSTIETTDSASDKGVQNSVSYRMPLNAEAEGPQAARYGPDDSNNEKSTNIELETTAQALKRQKPDTTRPAFSPDSSPTLWESSPNGTTQRPMRSKSQPLAEHQKNTSRTKSDGSARRQRKSSPDDAMWNASDTDDSES